MELLMGIDIGSTSIVAAVYETNGRLRAIGQSPTKLTYNHEGVPQWSCWMPEDIWGGVVRAVRKALESAPARDVKAAAVTGFGSDLVPIDREGNALYPFISWICNRADKQMAEWKRQVGRRSMFGVNGKQGSRLDTIFKLDWLAKTHPELTERTDKFLFVEDYTNFKLCGARFTDYSMAGTSAAFSLESLAWETEYILRGGWKPEQFPEPLWSGAQLGEITAEASSETGLAPGTKIILGGHDNQIVALAAKAVTDDVLLDVMGTWEILYATGYAPDLSERKFSAGMSVDAHVLPGCYSNVIHETSGGVLEWMKNTLCKQEVRLAKEAGRNEWSCLMELAAQSPEGACGVTLLPFFSGRSSIDTDPFVTGGYLGMQEFTKIGDIIRATVEGLNFQSRELLETLESAVGRRYDKIICVGGITRNDFLMQNKADIFARRLTAIDIPECAALGAAMTAGIGAGVYADYEEASRAVSGALAYKEYTPVSAKREKYDALFGVFKAAYRATKEVSHIIRETQQSGIEQ